MVQGGPLDVRHDEILQASLLAREVDRHDVGLVQPGQYLLLGIRPFAAPLIRSELARSIQYEGHTRTISLAPNGAASQLSESGLHAVGRKQWVMAYEPLCEMTLATDEQRRLAELTTAVYDAYVAGDFSGCIEAANWLDRAFGASKLTALYCEACNQHIKEPPTNFEGQIVLKEKGG